MPETRGDWPTIRGLQVALKYGLLSMFGTVLHDMIVLAPNPTSLPCHYWHAIG